jgi:1,4-alpha-glucan branching enzyme
MGKKILSQAKPDTKTGDKTIGNGGLKRTYSKDRSICNVTFSLPKEAAPGAQSVVVAGNFNNWDPHVCRMKKLKNGDYSRMVKLAANHAYEFRYIIDDTRWENAWNADKNVWSPYGNCENSVVIT